MNREIEKIFDLITFCPFLVKDCLAIPELLLIMRCSSSGLCPKKLWIFDELLRSCLKIISNKTKGGKLLSSFASNTLRWWRKSLLYIYPHVSLYQTRSWGLRLRCVLPVASEPISDSYMLKVIELWSKNLDIPVSKSFARYC